MLLTADRLRLSRRRRPDEPSSSLCLSSAWWTAESVSRLHRPSADRASNHTAELSMQAMSQPRWCRLCIADSCSLGSRVAWLRSTREEEEDDDDGEDTTAVAGRLYKRIHMRRREIGGPNQPSLSLLSSSHLQNPPHLLYYELGTNCRVGDAGPLAVSFNTRDECTLEYKNHACVSLIQLTIKLTNYPVHQIRIFLHVQQSDKCSSW